MRSPALLRICAMALRLALLLGLAGAPGSATAPGGAMVRSCFWKACEHWKDTDGNRIEAHAAGMLQSPLDGRWYWYGETEKTGQDQGVNVYSAETIAGPWRFEGRALGQGDIRVGEPGPYVVERPKVLFSESSRQFVMWFHLDNTSYGYRHAGVAVSETAAGPFRFVHALQPDGIPSLDMSVFQDFDGQAYFVRSCDNAYVGISRLSADYLNTTGLISKTERREGMGIFRHANGTYYMITSHLTGWEPNPLTLFRARGDTLDDPRWEAMGNPTGDGASFNSQPTYVVKYTPKQGEPYFIYMADNWVHAGPRGLRDAAYVWLPFRFERDSVRLDRRYAWDLENPFAEKQVFV